MSLSERITRSKGFLFGIAVTLVVLMTLEAAARITAHDMPWLNSRYVTMSQGFPDLDSLIADAGWGPSAGGLKYYDDFLYSARPATKKHITFTNYYSSRHTPDSVPLETADHIVWTFGGSTMENTETTDRLTIANVWARMFNEALGPTHVKNFGVGGFSSSNELVKFQKLLRVVPTEERPTIAVFYDGYNDAVHGFRYGAGSIQRDLALKLQALVEGDHLKLSLYASSNLLASGSKLWERTGKPAIDHLLFPLGAPNIDDPENLTRTVQTYVENVRMIDATCDAFAIACVFVLQPLLLTKAPLAIIEQQALKALTSHPRMGPDAVHFVRNFYSEATNILSDHDGFVDASNILNGNPKPFFYDIGHTGALAAPIIGELVGTRVLARLR